MGNPIKIAVSFVHQKAKMSSVLARNIGVDYSPHSAAKPDHIGGYDLFGNFV